MYIYLTITREKKSEKSILKIKNRLGGERTKEALELLHSGKIYECVLTLLYYYDKAYKLNIVEDKLINMRQFGFRFNNKINFKQNIKKTSLLIAMPFYLIVIAKALTEAIHTK